MIEPRLAEPGSAIHLQLSPALSVDDASFADLCRQNPDLRIERTAEGAVIIMAPAGSTSGRRNLAIGALLYLWARADGTGTSYDSSAGFKLPNGAIRSPDAAWVTNDRLAALPPGAEEGFAPLCPDFVVELRSSSDRLTAVQAKMDEYIANGARLGWLFDPIDRTVYVYRPTRPVEVVVGPAQMAGDPELPGFVLPLDDVWR
ncbi:MAG: Uma2 family endonuclease [Ardenticatenales bacterium]|nr:Uma2 family endonuclease [Ardenticatenales bacterium]